MNFKSIHNKCDVAVVKKKACRIWFTRAEV